MKTTIAKITSVTVFKKSMTPVQVTVTKRYKMKIAQVVSFEPFLEQSAFDALLP